MRRRDIAVAVPDRVVENIGAAAGARVAKISKRIDRQRAMVGVEGQAVHRIHGSHRALEVNAYHGRAVRAPHVGNDSVHHAIAKDYIACRSGALTGRQRYDIRNR